MSIDDNQFVPSLGLGLRESHADADGIGPYGVPDAH